VLAPRARARSQVGVVYDIWMARADPYGGKTYLSSVLLDAPLCPLPYETTNIFSSLFSLISRGSAPLSSFL